MTSPLMLAAIENHVTCVETLIEFGAFVNARRSTGSTALFLAAQCGHYDVVSVLLKCGAMVDFQNMTGGTALFAAAQMGHVDIVELLCHHGANVHLSLKDRTTPLFVASQNGFPDVVRALERHRADVNCRRVDGVSPVWIASQMGNEEIVEILCSLGAQVDKPRNSDGVTALFKASSNGYVDVVTSLLKYFPNTGVIKCGYSPLHAAAIFGHLDVVEVLLENGTDSNVKDKDGMTSSQLAVACGFEQVANFIDSF